LDFEKALKVRENNIVKRFFKRANFYVAVFGFLKVFPDKHICFEKLHFFYRIIRDNMKREFFKENKWNLLVLFFLFVLFFYKIFTGGVPYTGDFFTMSLPWKSYIYNSFKTTASLPYFNPYVFSGLPFIANIQAGIFYPVDLMFYFIEPFASFRLSFLINYFIYLCGSYFLISLFSKNKLAVLSGTAAIGFAWFPVAYSPLKQVFNAYVWIPFMFYNIFQFSKIGNEKNILYFAVCAGFSLLGGHPQFSYYAVLFSIIIFAAATISNRKILNLKKLAHIILSIAIFFIIVFPQLYPTLKFNESTTRNETDDLSFSSDGSLEPAKLICVFVPDIFGNTVEGTDWGRFWRPLKLAHTHNEFIGLFPILVIMLAFPAVFKNKKILFIFLLGIFSLIIGMGKYTPVFKLLFEFVPGFNKFREPHRILFFYEIFLAITAAGCFQYFLSRPRGAYKTGLKKILAVSILTYLIFIAVFVFFDSQILNKIIETAYAKYSVKSNHINDWNFYANFIVSSFKSATVQLHKFFIFLIAYLIVFYISDKSKKYAFLLLIVFIADIYSFNWKFFENKTVAEIEKLINEYDGKELGFNDFRVLPLVPLDHIFALNGPMYYKIRSVRGYDPLVDSDYIFYMRNIETNITDVHPNTEISRPDLNSQLLNLLNIEFIASDLPLQNPPDKIKFLKKYKDLHIYQNLENIGYAKIYSKILFEPDLLKSYNLLKNNSVDCKNVLIVNSENQFFGNSNVNPGNCLSAGIFETPSINLSKINEILFYDNYSRITGFSESESFLFVSEKYVNFNVLYNDKPCKILRANYLFISIKLSKGHFDIKLYPKNFF